MQPNPLQPIHMGRLGDATKSFAADSYRQARWPTKILCSRFIRTSSVGNRILCSRFWRADPAGKSHSQGKTRVSALFVLAQFASRCGRTRRWRTYMFDPTKPSPIILKVSRGDSRIVGRPRGGVRPYGLQPRQPFLLDRVGPCSSPHLPLSRFPGMRQNPS